MESPISSNDDMGLETPVHNSLRGRCTDMRPEDAQRYIDTQQAVMFNPATEFAAYAAANGVHSVSIASGHAALRQALTDAGVHVTTARK